MKSKSSSHIRLQAGRYAFRTAFVYLGDVYEGTVQQNLRMWKGNRIWEARSQRNKMSFGCYWKRKHFVFRYEIST